MIIVANFDPSASTKDSFTVPQSAFNGAMVVWNESNISLQFTFQTGDTAYIPAWGARKFYGSYGGSTITWEQQAQLASNQPPLSQVVVEVYAQGDGITDIFPLALASRQNNIGNAATVTTAASSIQNDGNVAGTSIVESTVSGDIPSCVTLTNDGILSIGNASHAGSVSFDNGKITSNGAGTLTAQATAGGVMTGSSLTLSGAVSATQILLAKNSISRIALAGPFTLSTTAKTAENHGLGAAPDIALAILDTDSIAGSQVLIDYSSFTATQVSCKAVGIGSGSAVFYLLTIKF